MDPITDLEGAALVCVHRSEPCTAHYVRTRFRESPSARFSDSAGSVYPMMRRLEKRGLLSSRLRDKGQRKVRHYVCTQKGRRAVRLWVGPPVDVNVGVSIDPLRTRMLYLGALSPQERLQWLDQSEKILIGHLSQIESRPSQAGSTEPDLFLELAHENARLQTRARLIWLRSARRRLRESGALEET